MVATSPDPDVKLLFYEHRPSQPPVLQNPLVVMTMKEFQELLNNKPGINVKISVKEISKFTSNVEIEGWDLWNEEEKARFADKPTAHASLASVSLPLRIRFHNALRGTYTEVYVVSHQADTTQDTEANGNHVNTEI